MASNTVTLTFAANTKPLTDGLRTVDAGLAGVQSHMATAGASTELLGKELATAGKNARGTAEIFRGIGGASVLMGGEVGAATQSLILLATTTKELTRGASHVVPAIKEWAASLTLLRGAGILAGAALLGFGIQQEMSSQGSANWAKKAAADANYALASNVHFVTQGVPLLGRLTGAWQNSADDISKSAHSMVESAKAAEDALAKAIHERFLFTQPDANPGGDAIVTALDMQNISSEVYGSQSPGYAASASNAARGTGGSLKSAADKIAADAKAAAQKLNEARKSVAQAMGGIVAALAGKLSAADAGTAGTLTHQLNGTYALEGATKGTSLMEKLRKQAKDTKRLAADLKQLARLGLDKGLLSQLVNGGLDSLPAAEELLRGGSRDVSMANVLNRQISGSAGRIAVAEANRNLSKKDKTYLEINVKGGTDDLAKLLRKWIRTQGGVVQTALGS